MKQLPNPLSMLPDRLIVALCTCGPVGTWGRAPGTKGSVLGVVLYTLFFFRLSLLFQLMLTAILVGLAIILCGEGERRMQKRDPGEMVLDEVVAIPLCFIGIETLWTQTGHVWIYMLAGFALFRIYDIAKPLGINRLQRFPGGLGVVLDDLAAALATNITLWLFYLAYMYGGWDRI